MQAGLNRSTRASTTAVTAFAVMLAACTAAPDATNIPGEPNGSAAQPRREGSLLSAFFGLDNGLLPIANRICRGAAGQDGMPVIFSSEVDPKTLQASDFAVTSRSGKTGTVHCVSFLPATDAGELRTALLVGEFGNAKDDPPVRVAIKDQILSLDGAVDFASAQADVTPLADGPSLVMAELVSIDAKDQGLGLWRTRGSKCPAQGIVQAVRVVWAGGVTLKSGDEPGDAERQLYKVTVRAADGKQRDVIPAALADLGDGDNNHVLCLDTADQPVAVAFPAGVLTDPNDDLNPETRISISRR